jgi:hypothetical protein
MKAYDLQIGRDGNERRFPAQLEPSIETPN